MTGTYSVTGITGISSGTLVPDANNFISGASVQERLLDNNGITSVIAGGPGGTLNGLGLDRSLQANFGVGGSSEPLYTVNMTH